MNKLELQFFEEYKKVDNLCKDMFGTGQGMTTYIQEMEAVADLGRQQVPGWQEKYKMLKHLRWIRNQIAHDEAVEELYEDDLMELQHFHQHLLHRKDPLAMVRGTRQARSVGKQEPYPWRQENYAVDTGDERIPAGAIVAVLVIVVLAVSLIVGYLF